MIEDEEEPEIWFIPMDGPEQEWRRQLLAFVLERERLRASLE